MSTRAIETVLNALGIALDSGAAPAGDLVSPRGQLRAALMELDAIKQADRAQRDAFAMAVLPTIAALDVNAQEAARKAYEYADAMMAERDKA